MLAEAPRELIRERRCNAEWALVQQMERLVAQFDRSRTPTCASARPTSCRWSSACSRR
jgi:phosphoenolpyruvate-protein kinase (PTS system EI component)